MVYVVGAAQSLHFKQLFKLLELMGYDWAGKCQHVDFGLVNQMSTRKGTAVFLEVRRIRASPARLTGRHARQDILNEAKSVMLEIMKEVWRRRAAWARVR